MSNKSTLYLMLVLIAISCNNDSHIKGKISAFYEKDVTIDNVEVKTIYATTNKLQKIKNFLLMNELYIKRDSLAHVMLDKADKKSNNEYAFKIKNDEILQKLNSNKKEHQNMIEEMNNEILKLNKKGKDRVKYYLVYYFKKKHENRYSVIMDSNYKIVYAQDSELD